MEEKASSNTPTTINDKHLTESASVGIDAECEDGEIEDDHAEVKVSTAAAEGGTDGGREGGSPISESTGSRKSSKEGVSLHQQVVAIPPFQAQLIVPRGDLHCPTKPH